MALGRGEVDEPAVGEQVEPAAVGEHELLDELARLARLGRERRAAPRMSISTLKWPGVGEDRAVLHPLEVLARDHVLVAGRRAEDVADLGARLAIGMTSKPSIAASSARIGSTSVTITCAPMPRARIATPRPTQP